MVHSSLRSLGHVAGGADTVVGALLEALGPSGTLVVPTFTYPVANEPGFVFDPLHTPSNMGAISEAARQRPEARRSIHLWHSVAAIGPLAESIATSGGASAWDSDSPMRRVLDGEGVFLLLGVPYQNLTAVHLCEVEFDVPYRNSRVVTAKMRRADGSIVPLVSAGHARQRGHPGSDFNRLGQRMEDAGLVKLGTVGNAIARLFQAHDLHRSARELYAQDPRGFLKQNGGVTRLSHGHTLETPKGEYCVADPARMYRAP